MRIERLPTRPSASTAAEHVLREAIVSGELAAGERLPSERVLSAKLGVSRLTLRAALATLAAAGLISVRHGSGYTVRDMRETGGTDLLPELVGQARTPDALADAAADLLRLRRHLAAAVLEAIAERKPPAPSRRAIDPTSGRGFAAIDPSSGRGFAAIDAAIERFAEAMESGELAAIVEADLGIVRALLDATGSTILHVCLNPIIAVLRDSAPLRRAMYAEPAGNLAGWRALAAWVERPQAATIPVLIAVLAERDRLTVHRMRQR